MSQMARLALRAAVAAAVAATTAAPASAASLRWGACPDGTPAGYECATLRVPADPAHPRRGTTPIALIRTRATGPRRARIGSLVMNFGGPGGSGLATLPSVVPRLPRAVRRAFDIVSFDPRGVGHSAPIDCGTDLDPVFGADPATAEGAAAIVAGYRRLGADCAARVGRERLSRLGTHDVVADLDRIRAALGDRRLTFAGLSYGTRIGALYADRYPHRVRALVLDAAMDPRADLVTLGLDQGAAWEDVLLRVLAECAADAGCPLGPDPVARFDELLARVRAEPLPAPGDPTGRSLTVGWLTQAVVTGLANVGSHRPLLAALADALQRGDGTTLLAVADQAVGRDTRTGAYLDLPQVFAAVNCLDFPARPAPSTLAAGAALATIQAPRMGAAGVYADSALCVGWPVPPRPVQPATAPDAPPILVVGTISDPSTPYAWSQRLATTLRSARLLTYDGIGHTVFGRAGGNGSACTDRWIARYLLTRAVPPAGTVCRAPVPVAAP